MSTSKGSPTPETPDPLVAVSCIRIAEQERKRLLMAEMLVRSLQHHLITEDAFLKKAKVLDAPGGPETSAQTAKPPPPGLLPG